MFAGKVNADPLALVPKSFKVSIAAASANPSAM